MEVCNCCTKAFTDKELVKTTDGTWYCTACFSNMLAEAFRRMECKVVKGVRVSCRK